MIEVLKQAYQLLLTEPHAPTVCDQLEVIFRRAIAELESQEHNFCPRCGKRTNDIHTCTPPQRTWVGLTNDEVDSWELPDHPTVYEFAKFIEAKLKEKNT
jgi:hypothetical protein